MPLPRRLALACALTAAPAALAQPVNDSCSAPTAISGFGITPFDLTGATTDGAPDTLCNAAGSAQIYNDVWYCWTPSAGGPVAVRTCNQTTLDSKLAVYEGCACPGGSPLACNDDSCGLQSVVSFFAMAGHTYMIRVGTYSAAQFGAGAIEVASGIIAGPIVNPANGHSYYLLNPSSWTSAEATAVQMGGHLATVRNADENEFLRANIAGFDGADRRLWIGLNDAAQLNVYVWTSGEPVTYTNWDPGEPSHAGGLEHWVELFGSNGHWNDNRDVPNVTVYGCVEVLGGACRADFNGDGSVNVQDFLAFLQAFAGADPRADMTGDGSVNIQDFLAYLQLFAAGC
jgi:hypothetical protein